MSIGDIMKRTGIKSRNNILWVMKLADAPKEIHEAITAGLISSSLASEFIGKFKDKAVERMQEVIAAMKDESKPYSSHYHIWKNPNKEITYLKNFFLIFCTFGRGGVIRYQIKI